MEESTDHRQRIYCEGKLIYSKKEAISAKNLREKGRGKQGRGRRRKKPAKNLRAYHCPQCNGWHLTKT